MKQDNLVDTSKLDADYRTVMDFLDNNLEGWYDVGKGIGEVYFELKTDELLFRIRFGVTE